MFSIAEKVYTGVLCQPTCRTRFGGSQGRNLALEVVRPDCHMNLMRADAGKNAFLSEA